jgi:hypothetical protein
MQCTVIVVEPAVVGGPVLAWLVITSPAGGVPETTVQVYGPVPPPTPIVPMYGVPTVAGGGDVSVSIPAAGLITNVTGPVVVFCGLLVSVAFTVSVVVLAVVGVPLIVQFAIVKPAGSVPAVIVQAYGAVPPETPISPLYGTFTVPAGGDVSVNVPTGLIVRLTGPVVISCVLLESVAFTVRFTVPAMVGVPLTTQPAGVSTRPAGNTPAVMVQEYGAVPPVTPIGEL